MKETGLHCTRNLRACNCSAVNVDGDMQPPVQVCGRAHDFVQRSLHGDDGAVQHGVCQDGRVPAGEQQGQRRLQRGAEGLGPAGLRLHRSDTGLDDDLLPDSASESTAGPRGKCVTAKTAASKPKSMLTPQLPLASRLEKSTSSETVLIPMWRFCCCCGCCCCCCIKSACWRGLASLTVWLLDCWVCCCGCC